MSAQLRKTNAPLDFEVIVKQKRMYIGVTLGFTCTWHGELSRSRKPYVHAVQVRKKSRSFVTLCPMFYWPSTRKFRHLSVWNFVACSWIKQLRHKKRWRRFCLFWTDILPLRLGNPLSFCFSRSVLTLTSQRSHGFVYIYSIFLETKAINKCRMQKGKRKDSKIV